MTDQRDTPAAPYELRTVVSDGRPIVQLRCPDCGRWGEIDGDQLHGRVSVDHTSDGCTYHETVDYAATGFQGWSST